MLGINENNSSMAGMLDRNPTNTPLSLYSTQLPRYKVVKVKGEAGAKNFKMGPDSDIILLDDSGTMIWLVQTDGTGFITATPFDIKLHQETPLININNLAERVAQLEEIINAKYNTGTSKQSRKQHQQQQQQQSSTNKNLNEPD